MGNKEKILELFLHNNQLKFNEIEKLAEIRSNKLDYHLKKLIQEDILEKNKEYYFLAENSEEIIPYLSSKRAVLPVILIKIGSRKKFFLYRREKRPYKGRLSLPGGRMVLGEDISHAVTRIMKEKYSIKAKLSEVNSVSLEHVMKGEKTVHAFLLILVSAKAEGEISMTDILKNRMQIIPSDYKLLKKPDSRIRIEKIISKIDPI